MAAMHFLRKNKGLLYWGVPIIFVFALEDRSIMSWLKRLDQCRSSLYLMLRHMDPFINFIGHGTTLLIAACLLFVIGKAFSGTMNYAGTSLSYTGKALMLSFFAAGISVQILKHIIGRARPAITESFVMIGPTLEKRYDSFPSGHSAVVFCFACVLSRQFPQFRIAFYCIASIIGLMRVVDLSHFPSDVAAGALLGVIIGNILWEIQDERRGKEVRTYP